MEKNNLKQKLKQQLRQIGYRVVTTVILTLTAVVTVWAYAAFVEPLAGPNSSDQDFLQNILGANNNDNDFDSSSVVANNDGSIVERLEYVQGQGSTTPTCGNGVLEAGEGCDDGGISWTAGACAGDCSKRNYWSLPSIGSIRLGPDNPSEERYCQERGFLKFTSVVTSSAVTSTTANSYPCSKSTWYGARYFLNPPSTSNFNGWANSLITFSSTGCQPGTWSYWVEEIWCAD